MLVLKSYITRENIMTTLDVLAIPSLAYAFRILPWTKADLENDQRRIGLTMFKFRMHHRNSAPVVVITKSSRYALIFTVRSRRISFMGLFVRQIAKSNCRKRKARSTQKFDFANFIASELTSGNYCTSLHTISCNEPHLTARPSHLFVFIVHWLLPKCTAGSPL